MLTTKNLAFAFTLAIGAVATGCAADSPDDDNDPNNPDNPNNPDGTPKQLDASGKFQMQSTFDLATNAPGKVGDVTRAIIDATDSPEDPSLWVIERIIDQMPSGTFKNVLNTSKGFIAGYVNDRVLDLAPDFVSTMVQVGQDFGQIAKNFGLNETLEVTKTADGYVAVRTAVGAHFKIDNIESDHNFADFSVANIVVQNVGVSLDQTGKLGIADHKMGITFGSVLRVGLDGAIIPMIDPTAKNLGELLQHKVNCLKVGTAVRDAVASVIGYGGSVGTYETACKQGLVAGAGVIYSKIAAIDSSALEFGLTGTAKGLDKNGDKQIDSIQTGAWSGNLSYAGTPAPLAGATFFGERM
ncbi:MAG: hypothetical protein M4D80_25170 [Myxococcota bacterium]|nr:hypothetical protein [Deltaproteobacteria bacterium]MDQ3338472.1 hypothetical protein [Myxococcota bacterium]